MKNSEEIKKEINSALFIFFIFEYSILNVLDVIINFKALIIIVTILCTLFILYINKSSIQINTIIVFTIITLIISINSLLNYQIIKYNTIILIYFFSIFISGYIFGCLKIEREYVFKYSVIFSTVNFILLNIELVTTFEKSNYMRFGYSMIISTLFFCELATKRYKKLFASLAVISLAEAVIFGCRGSLVVIFIYIFMKFIMYKKIKIISKITIISMIILGIYFFKENIESIILKVFSNINTYAVNKYIYMIKNGIDSKVLSGRDVIYESSIEVLKNKPLFGNGIGYFQSLGEYYTYAHNFFIEIIVELGLIVTIVFLLYLIIMFLRILKLKKDWINSILIILISISFGRLLFSSSFWIRPEFAQLVGFVTSYGMSSALKRNSNYRMNIFRKYSLEEKWPSHL